MTISVVAADAAVEPLELCDHVQMQGNRGSKWVLGEKDSSQISTTLTAHS